MEGYQVSNQCQALVRDECLVPTKDAPELAFARQSTAEKYIPDVYYKVSEIWLVQFLVFFFFLRQEYHQEEKGRQRSLRVFQHSGFPLDYPRMDEVFFLVERF